MILLWLALIVSSVHCNSGGSLHLKHIDNYNEHRDACFGEQLPLKSWLVQIHNADSGKWYTGAFISERHVLTVKEAVTSIQDGVEKLTNLSRLNLNVVFRAIYKLRPGISVKHVVIPVDYNEQNKETRLLDLVIMEVELPFAGPSCRGRASSECFKYICPYFDKPSPELIEKSGFVFGYYPPDSEGAFPRARYLRFTDQCDGCAHFIHIAIGGWSEMVGDVLVTGEVSYFDGDYAYPSSKRLHGLDINATSAIRLRHWEPFICEHTGVCIENSIQDKDVRHKITDKSRKNQHYIIDGKLILYPCTEANRRHLMKESTLFNRLSLKEVKDVKENCGYGNLTSSVLILSTTGSCPENPIETETCYCPCPCPPCRLVTRICEGTLITGRHVITSGDCLKNINKLDDELRVAFVSEYGESSISSINRRNDSTSMEGTEWGHRFMSVHRVAIPAGEGDKIKHGIAILELHENVKANFSDHNSTVPMCLSPRTPFLPETLDYFGMTSDLIMYEEDCLYASIWDKDISDIFLDGYQNMNFFMDNVTVPVKCRQEECSQVEFDGQRAYGSSLSQLQDGRRYLHGVATLFNDSHVDWAVRISPYRTFICLHTGLCDDDEMFNEDEALLPYRVSGDGIVVGFIEELNEQRKTFEPHVHWNVVRTMMKFANETISIVRPLTEEEYKGQSCGGKSELFEWPVAIGIIPEFGLDMQTICTGAFISARHVLTSRSCMLPHVSKRHLVVHYTNSYEVKQAMATGPRVYYAQSDVAHVIYPDRNGTFPGHNVDIAVVELAEDAKVSDPFMELPILCVPHEDDRVLDSVVEWLGVSGKEGIRNYTVDMRHVNITAGDDTTETVSDTNHKYSPQETDLGSPWVRQNLCRMGVKDKVLYGVTTTSAKNDDNVQPRYTKTQDVLELICRMSGVCPMTKNRYNPWVEKDIYVNGKRYCV